MNNLKKIIKPIGLFFCTYLLVSCVHNETAEDKASSEMTSIPQEKIIIPEAKKAQSSEASETNTLPPNDAISNSTTQANHSAHEYSISRPNLSKETKAYLKSQVKKLESNGSLPTIKSRVKLTPGIAKIDNAIEGKDIVQLDYEQVELRQVLEEISDTLGISIVIDPSVNTKVTMRTAPDNPLEYKDLWPLLNMLLSESGITLEKKSGVFYAKKSPIFLPEEMGYASMLSQSNAAQVMQITPLRYISIESALAVLRPMIGSASKISQIAQLNTLSIISSPDQLKRMNGLLSIIDVDPFRSRGIRIYKIRDAEAQKVAQDLTDILKLIEGTVPAYQVLALERINSLLVVAPPGRGFKSVDRWVDILDEGEDVVLQEQIFIYRCKNVQCESLAETLNSILDKSSAEKQKTKKEDQEENSPNVFRTVPKDSLSVKAIADKTFAKPQAAPKKQSKVLNTEGGSSADINATIVADQDSNALLVRTTARDYRQLLETIRLLDKVPLEVLINVVIAQVTLSDSQSLGIDWSSDYGSRESSVSTNLGVAQSISTDGKPLGLIFNHLGADWRITLNAVAKNSDINILSRPSLLIANNQEGSINVGKEVPVQTSETTNLDSGTGDSVNQVTQEIAYRKTGIQMTITPHINDDGVINMEISQSLSSIEGTTSSSDAGFKPTFGNQEIKTNVITIDSQTIILGGLIESVIVDGETGVPYAKDVPILGPLFKTRTQEIERRELVLIITPKIIGRETDISEFNSEFNKRFHSVSHFLNRQIGDSY